MTALIVHPTGLSLGALPSPKPLALPSRFPENKQPHAAVGNNIYVYAANGPVGWEYDRAGRRLSEMNVGTGVHGVVCVGAAVGVRVSDGVKVMVKKGKKWECSREFKVPAGEVRMMGEDSTLVLVGDEVWVYDIATGTRTILDIDSPTVCAIAKHNGLSLVVPMGEGLECVPLDGGRQRAVNFRGKVAHMAAAYGKVAVANEDIVSVVSLDGKSVERVAFDGDVDSVAWLDADTLVATVSQKLVMHDIKSDTTTPMKTDPVVGVHPVHARPKSDRVLSDSHVPNLQKTENPKADKERRVASADSGSDAGKAKENAKPRPRAVSGNMGPPPLPLPKAKPIPAISRVAERQLPLATPSNPMMARPAPTGTGDTLRLRPPTADDGTDVPSPASTMAPPTPAATSSPGWDAFEEMRREIANLQMDMLRMGRGLKNEIRSAVAPLVDELRASRETIAQQAAEIERLRRGF